MNTLRVSAPQVFLQNVIAGLTVSFVALSLGAAFGLLSGRGAFAGMMSAAVIAFVTALLGGTRIQCSGPTGPMTAVTAVAVAFAHSSLAEKMPGANAEHFVNIVLLLTGFFLVLFAALRLGKFIVYIPNVVISGFMNGIAVIIWLDQAKKLFGFAGKAAYKGPIGVNVGLAVASAALVFILPRLTRRLLPRFANLLSATFITIVFMTSVAWFAGLDVERVQLSSTLHSLADFRALLASQWPDDWSSGVLLLALPFALQLAFLGYLDTLMTSLVVDKLTGERTKSNQELLAQGLANGAVAVFGGIPGAQATIRSVLIVAEKATWRLAGVLVGVFAFAEMLLLQNAINLIPQAVFAGILIKVGYDVFDWLPVRLYFKELLGQPYSMLREFFSRHDDQPIFVTNREMAVIVGTTLVTVAWDLNIAVFIFTGLFYLHNLVLNRRHPMRDLQPLEETAAFVRED